MATAKITFDASQLDEAIEKANRLCELLREVQQISNSLFTVIYRLSSDFKNTVPASSSMSCQEEKLVEPET